MKTGCGIVNVCICITKEIIVNSICVRGVCLDVYECMNVCLYMYELRHVRLSEAPCKRMGHTLCNIDIIVSLVERSGN